MRDIFTILVVGCIGANAAVNHYDLLGRRGSEMNSPMVYKDIDYTKLKKNEQQKESTPPGVRALQKMGLSSNVEAIEGAYRSGQNQNKLFYFKKNGDNCTGSNACLYNWNNYRNRSNEAFIDINIDKNPVQYGSSAPWSYLPSFVDHYTPNANHASEPSPYYSGDYISHVMYGNIKTWVFYSYFTNVGSWYNNKASNVGIYMATDGLPSKLKTTRDVKYFRDNNTDTFKDGPGYENRESKTFNLIKEATAQGNVDRSVVFVGRMDPTNPANKTPQIYIGVRNDRVGYSSNYDNLARDLDNFIYQYRTLEFVPVGNDGRNNKYMNYQAHAANAVTVGAVNGYYSPVIANYSSTIPHTNGSDKPEIYNYSDFVNNGDNTERMKRYHYGNNDYQYQGYYNGSEMATAYTAGMVADFLAVNPFYRWHPEVVKAFLITADGGQTISNASSTVTNKTLSYRYLIFDYADPDHGDYKYESRYWNGDISKLKSRTNNNNKQEIWFVTRNLGNSSKWAHAAISWLSSGDDIANNNGKVPQDFDLYVYGSNDSKYDCMTKPGVNLNSSSVCGGYSFNFSSPGYALENINDGNVFKKAKNLGKDTFEKVSLKVDYEYLIFKIVLFSDNSSNANKGQIALGFNLSASL